MWSCWIELLQYLDVESGWLNTLEEKVQATENIPENTESVSEALEVTAFMLKVWLSTLDTFLQPKSSHFNINPRHWEFQLKVNRVGNRKSRIRFLRS